MNSSQTSFSDLAPKLGRELSLRRPQDYARLLFWCFCFPQAVRWYVDEYCIPTDHLYQNQDAVKQDTTWSASFRNPVRRRLVLQYLFTSSIAITAINWILYLLGMELSWAGVFLGATLGVGLGVVAIIGDNIAEGIVAGMIAGIGYSSVVGMAVGFGFDHFTALESSLEVMLFGILLVQAGVSKSMV